MSFFRFWPFFGWLGLERGKIQNKARNAWKWLKMTRLFSVSPAGAHRVEFRGPSGCLGHFPLRDIFFGTPCWKRKLTWEIKNKAKSAQTWLKRTVGWQMIFWLQKISFFHGFMGFFWFFWFFGVFWPKVSQLWLGLANIQCLFDMLFTPELAQHGSKWPEIATDYFQ